MNLLHAQTLMQKFFNVKTRAHLLKPQHLGYLMNCWPPFLGAGIFIKHITDDWKQVDVQLNMRWYNRNYVGSHFGGSLFSMTDPFYMLMLINVLGKDYVVWDQAAKIKFIKPGFTHVNAHFALTDDVVASIIERAESGEKVLETFTVNIVSNDTLIATVAKTVYIRKKCSSTSDTAD